MGSAMEIQSRKVGKVTILDISGDIAFSERKGDLFTRIQELLDDGEKSILLNTKDVGHVDSTGIGEIVRSYTTVTNGGGQLKLVNVRETLYEVLSITKLLMIFDTFKDEGEALASF